MGCLGSDPLPEEQRKKNPIDDHIKIDTDDFVETDYPIFYPHFYPKKHKNIQKGDKMEMLLEDLMIMVI